MAKIAGEQVMEVSCFFFFFTSKAKTAQPMHIMPVIMSHARARVVAAGRRRRFFLLQEGKTPKGEFLIRNTWLEKLRVCFNSRSQSGYRENSEVCQCGFDRTSWSNNNKCIRSRVKRKQGTPKKTEVLLEYFIYSNNALAPVLKNHHHCLRNLQAWRWSGTRF